MTRTTRHDAEHPEHPATIPAALALAAERWPDTEAFVEGDRRWTFRQYRSDVLAIARGLISAQVEPGDRVAIWAPNSTEFALAAMAVYCAGGIVVPLNTRLTEHEASLLIRRAHARIVFAFTEFLGREYLESLRNNGLLRELDAAISLRGEPVDGTLTLDHLVEQGRAVDESAVLEREARIAPEDISDILFTSGTTGFPKGAMLKHEATCRAYTEYGRSMGIRPGDRIVGIAPFFHTFGLKGIILTATLYGATILPVSHFEVLALAALIAREQATVLQGAPPIFQALLDNPGVDKAGLRSIRVAGPGAMGSSTTIYERLRDELGIHEFSPGYALTESSATATRCYWFDDFETASTTSGWPVPGTELRIVDDTGVDVGPNVDGEILIHGYNVMAGYFEEPEATAMAIDPEGWLHTGDIGRLDERGRLIVTDRKKDMFLVGGFNTYPAEIEGVLREHPDVIDVAVVGVRDARLGEVGKAFIVASDRASFDLDSVTEFARSRLANFKVPRHWVVVDDLPRNASGKVQKFVLREAEHADMADERAGRP